MGHTIQTDIIRIHYEGEGGILASHDLPSDDKR